MPYLAYHPFQFFHFFRVQITGGIYLFCNLVDVYTDFVHLFVHLLDRGCVGVDDIAVDIAALQSFDKNVLYKIIDKVYVYGGGRIEIIWKMDDIFFVGDKSKVIDVNEKKDE